MNIESKIILVVLVLILIPAVKSTVKHLQGEGSCCGGPKEKVKRKKIRGTKTETLKIAIEGMHCVNCKNRIENHLNALDGVTAKVNLDTKTAKVDLYKSVDHEEIMRTIEKLDFKVVSIQ